MASLQAKLQDIQDHPENYHQTPSDPAQQRSMLAMMTGNSDPSATFAQQARDYSALDDMQAYLDSLGTWNGSRTPLVTPTPETGPDWKTLVQNLRDSAPQKDPNAPNPDAPESDWTVPNRNDSGNGTGTGSGSGRATNPGGSNTGSGGTTGIGSNGGNSGSGGDSGLIQTGDTGPITNGAPPGGDGSGGTTAGEGGGSTPSGGGNTAVEEFKKNSWAINYWNRVGNEIKQDPWNAWNFVNPLSDYSLPAFMVISAAGAIEVVPQGIYAATKDALTQVDRYEKEKADITAKAVAPVAKGYVYVGSAVSYVTFAWTVNVLGGRATSWFNKLINVTGSNTQTLNPPQPIGKAAPNQVQVTSWAEAGRTPDLTPGRWVQVGGPTLWNYLMTGLWGGKVNITGRFPYITWQKSNASFSNYISGFVDQTQLMWPKGWEFIKGILGQRKLK